MAILKKTQKEGKTRTKGKFKKGEMSGKGTVFSLQFFSIFNKNSSSIYARKHNTITNSPYHPSYKNIVDSLLSVKLKPKLLLLIQKIDNATTGQLKEINQIVKESTTKYEH